MSTEDILNEIKPSFKILHDAGTSISLLAIEIGKVNKFLNLTVEEEIMANAVDERVYAYICTHAINDEILAYAKDLYDCFVVAA
jgi:hypothetical protein